MMKRSRQDTSLLRETAGFTLLELLLAVSIMGVLGLGLISVIEEIAQREVARATSKYMARASDAVVALLSDPVYFDHFYQDVAEDGGVKIYPLDLVKGNDLPAATSDDLTYDDGGTPVTVDIPDSNILSGSFRASNPHRAPIEYIFKIPANSGVGLNPRSIEFMVVTTRRVPDAKLRRSAIDAGASGGFFSSVGQADPDNPEFIRSVFGVWEIPVAELTGTTWHTDVTGADKPTADDGAYLVHYAYVNEQSTSGDYLYRVAVPSRTDLNRMNAPVIMNQHSVIGADNVLVNGVAAIETQAVARGSMRTSGATGNLVTFGSVITDERLQAQGMTVTNNMSDLTKDTYNFHPAFTGANTMEVETLTASEQIQAQTANLDVINARSLRSEGDTTINGNLSADQAAGVGVDRGLIDVGRLTTTGAGTTAMNVGGQTRIQEGQYAGGANSLRTVGSALGVLTYQNNDVGSTSTILGTVSGQRVNLNDAVINPGITINCEKGC